MTLLATSTISGDIQSNMFDCISIPVEIQIPTKDVPKLDYFVTEFPRDENDYSFSFVYGLFGREEISFQENQANILQLSNNMFGNSVSLTPEEHNIIMSAFKKSVKRTPTLPGRR